MRLGCNTGKALMLTALLFLALTETSRAQKDAIQWRITDWPPIYILEGPYKGQGAGDELIRLFAEQMPAYDHKTVPMNINRFYYEAKKGAKVLNAAGFPIAGVKASLPDSIIIPHQVIIRKDKARLPGSKDGIVLGELLSDKRFSAGITFGRYGPTLNQIVDKHKGEANIYSVTDYGNVFKMLFAGRFDYTIEYPPVIHYYEKLAQQEGRFLKLPIKEVAARHKYLVAYVIGPDNEWGDRVIAKINRIISEQRNTPRYREILLRWYDPAIRDQVSRYLDTVFADE